MRRFLTRIFGSKSTPRTSRPSTIRRQPLSLEALESRTMLSGGPSLPPGISFSAGVISAVGILGSDRRSADLIQHDAGINPGSSGGPLFDLKGQVVGVNSSIAKEGKDIGALDEPATIWRSVMESYRTTNAPEPAARPVPTTN